MDKTYFHPKSFFFDLVPSQILEYFIFPSVEFSVFFIFENQIVAFAFVKKMKINKMRMPFSEGL